MRLVYLINMLSSLNKDIIITIIIIIEFYEDSLSEIAQYCPVSEFCHC